MERSQRASGSEARPWTEEEDQKLIRSINEWKTEWKSVMERSQRASGSEARPWTEEEDQKLIKSINECKTENRSLSWLEIAWETALARSSSSCRKRWEYLENKH
ncbi:uncharacterized protein LOC132255065 [Vitis vinifera]|uniref:uncharacterized protein LOC132255065 n=1 Tax=Vitis vinifera TaxID=29760 RepID=UPI002882E53A|nr:uncharacterized protein LOC132255065 [Vitis vinifera]